MKKFLAIFVLFSLVAAVVPALVSAQVTQGNVPPSSCAIKVAVPGLTNCQSGNIAEGTDGFGMCCFVQTVDRITNWAFYIMMVIAILLFVYGGLTYMTALGDVEKAGKGKQIIIYAMIGLILALISKIVPNIVATLVRG